MAKKDILSSSKKIKRKRKVLKLFFSLVVLAVLLVGAVALARVDKFRVKEIKLESENKLLNSQASKAVAEVIAGQYLNILPKDNIFLLPQKEIALMLAEKFPRIKSTEIEVKLPNTLSIKCDERKQEALLCYGKECGFLDKSGFVFEKAPYFSGDGYLKFIDEKGESASLAIGKNIIEAGQFEKIMEIINLNNKGGIATAKVFIKSDTFFQLQTKEGWKILISDKNEPQITFDNLSLALAEKIKSQRKNLEYIDLRFGNKVYFKYK